jgi:hypothetical protein
MTERIYTAEEGLQFEKAEAELGKNGFDKWTQEGSQRNADLIDQFFQANPTLPVTLQNIYRAVEARKTEFVWLSQARVNWYETAKKNPQLANQLAADLATQGGKPGKLVNDGDQLFENLVLLFNELHSHPQPMAHAIDRISHRPGQQLHYVPQPRRSEPVSRAAKEDNGEPFVTSGLSKQKDGSLGKSPADYAREARERSEKNNPSPSQTPALDASEQTWKYMAEQLLLDGTHSQQSRVRAVYDREQGNGGGWRRVYEACKREANLYRNSRSIR